MRGANKKMAIKYKIDIMQALKEKGFSSYKIRKEKLIGERQLQQIRDNKIVSNACLEKLCKLLGCQLWDILEYSES